MWCPNIKHLKADGFEFVNAAFEVRFQGVVRFVIELDQESINDSAVASFGYASSEIDSDLPPQDSLTEWERLHSLIIDADSCWLTVVFGSVRVDAVEPLAFELMKRDPRFEIPWAQD